ncbi:MAG: winged helix-turn-helix domain-containing protein [Woeseiaceae bacterium]|jgi:DNA-binding winged helix-turn-helix (wHTH) protein/tetratricopeptide (TPR) repeat protein
MNEENNEKSEVYHFDECELDADLRELRVAGQPVTMQPKAFELLLYLVRNRHRAVDKDELQDALWPRSIVTETALTRCVMKARRAVDDDADKQAVIKTVHGHGYRFIARIRDATPPAAPAAEPPVAAPVRSARASWIGISAAAIIAFGTIVWFLMPHAVSGEVRLAVLPVENATGEEELDWTRMGLMALMNRMLEDQGVTVVSGNSVSSLAGETPVEELMRSDSEFREALQKTTAATHLVGATLESDSGLYRLTYTFDGGSRPERRTVVGPEPAALIRDVVTTITTMVTKGPPELERMSFVSNDDFLNEAYARAMSLQFEGRYQEAQRLFQVIVEQQPELFWPRYEYALAARNMRDYDNAERLMLELRAETQRTGELAHEAAVYNSLGVMYMSQRRNDEALAAFETVASLAADIQDTHYMAVANVNLGLLAKNKGDLPAAYNYMLAAKEVYEQADIESLPGVLLNNLSGVLILMGRLEEAEEMSVDAIANFQLTGKRLYESYALSRLSSIHRRNGLLDEAEDAALRAKVVRDELGDRRGAAASLLTLADIAYDKGDLTRSRQYAQQARDIGIEIDDQDVNADALKTIAKAQLALGEPQDAAANYAASEAISRNNEDRMNAFGARYGLAQAWIAMGNFDGARSIADEMIADSIENDRRREETAGYNLYAQLHIERDEWADAVASLEQVLAIAQELGDDNLGAGAHAGLARCWLELGDTGKASTHLQLVLSQRPADADIQRLQARLAAAGGNFDDAVSLMSEARTRAGESWTDKDEQMLAGWHQALADLAEGAEN